MAKLEIEVDLTGMPQSYVRQYRAIMRKIGEEVLRRIRKRTLKGLDANGKPFGEYKEGGGRIDLYDTGKMLDSMRVGAVSRTGFELNIGTDYAQYVEKRFKFFQLSNADMAYIAERVEEDFFDFLLDPKRQRKRSKGV